MSNVIPVTSAFASEPVKCRPYAYVRSDDEALSIDIRAWTPGRPGAPDFSLRVAKDDPIWLNLHQVNLLIARLTAARDAYQAALEAAKAEEAARYALLAEPDDAAPGHELIEPEQFAATITGGGIFTVDGRFRDCHAIWYRRDALEDIARICLTDDQELSIGDLVELARVDRHTLRLISVTHPSGGLPIDYFALRDRVDTPPEDEEERQRFYDDQRDSDERWQDALIGPGHEVSMFPAVAA